MIARVCYRQLIAIRTNGKRPVQAFFGTKYRIGIFAAGLEIGLAQKIIGGPIAEGRHV